MEFLIFLVIFSLFYFSLIYLFSAIYNYFFSLYEKITYILKNIAYEHYFLYLMLLFAIIFYNLFFLVIAWFFRENFFLFVDNFFFKLSDKTNFFFLKIDSNVFFLNFFFAYLLAGVISNFVFSFTSVLSNTEILTKFNFKDLLILLFKAQLLFFFLCAFLFLFFGLLGLFFILSYYLYILDV